MTITIDKTSQVEDWKAIQRMIHDARRMPGQRKIEYLQYEVFPRLKEYCDKYQTKYDPLNRPR